MIIVYTPEGGAEERYDIRRLLTSEASIIASTLGMRWAEVKEGVLNDDPGALRGCVWAMRKRTETGLRFKDFDPGVDEMVSRYDQREVADYISEALKVTGATDDERQMAYRILLRNAADPAAAEALLKEMTAEPGPKEDPAPNPTLTSSEPST